MASHRILFTGDFWHQDFQSIVSSFEVPVTLVPIEKISAVEGEAFDLVVVAQSRRSQFLANDVEVVQAMFGITPVVSLLGSWCEGESRSGTPLPGLIRVYWHQWQGRYTRFVQQLEQSGITSWHAPRTSAVSGQIEANSRPPQSQQDVLVGISAWTKGQHDMVADAVGHFGWKSCWVERSIWDAHSASPLAAVCVEADSWCAQLANRIRWILNEVPQAPIVLLLNYPRESEWDEMQACGVSEVVSKPFELGDLGTAIQRAIERAFDARVELSLNSKQ